MSCASKSKRIRLTERVIRKANGKKKERYMNKLAFLESMDSTAKFRKGSKQLGEGGYRWLVYVFSLFI